MRVFIDEGSPMAALLTELLKSRRRKAQGAQDDALLNYVRRLLAAFETPGGTATNLPSTRSQRGSVKCWS